MKLTVTLTNVETSGVLPQVEHQGERYVMAEPGAEYRVAAKLDQLPQFPVKFELLVDGRLNNHGWEGFPIGAAHPDHF